MFDRNRFVGLNYKQYVDLTDEEVQSRYNDIIERWEAFLDQNDKSLRLDDGYYVHSRNLFEIIRRCDKRVLYFYIFHDLKEECEYKEIAVLSFWLITLKPFMVINDKSPIYNCPNEMFALYLILSVIRGAYEKKFPGKQFNYPNAERRKDILYDFKYCSLSREAMIAFVETLADTYGVGISYILDNQSTNK